MSVCCVPRSFSLTRKGDLVNDGDEMVVLPTSPTSSVPGGDTCVTSSCLERRVSTLSYAQTPSMTGQRSRTCSVLSTGDVLGSAALAAAALLPDVAAAAALATKEVAVYRVMMLGGPGVGKTALTQQFVTSEYIAAQNTSFGRSPSTVVYSDLLFIFSFRSFLHVKFKRRDTSRCRNVVDEERRTSYTVFRKKHPLTFSFISPWKMFRFVQHFQCMFVSN